MPSSQPMPSSQGLLPWLTDIHGVWSRSCPHTLPSPYSYRNRVVEFAHSYLSIFSSSHHLCAHLPHLIFRCVAHSGVLILVLRHCGQVWIIHPIIHLIIHPRPSGLLLFFSTPSLVWFSLFFCGQPLSPQPREPETRGDSLSDRCLLTLRFLISTSPFGALCALYPRGVEVTGLGCVLDTGLGSIFLSLTPSQV